LRARRAAASGRARLPHAIAQLGLHEAEDRPVDGGDEEDVGGGGAMAKKKGKSRRPKRVYGFNVAKPEEPLFTSQAAWKGQMTAAGAKKYLTEHLRTQLSREVPVAIAAFEEANKTSAHDAGFYAVARMVFPVISFLGCLYKGTETTRAAVLFLEKYADPRYRKLAAAIFFIYRHGLIHTAMAKIVERDDKQAFGWRLKLNAPSDHLTIEPGVKIKNIVISLKDLYEDVIKALDAFATDFDGPKKDAMLTRFKRGYLKMAAIERIDVEGSTKMQAKLRASFNSIT
jgi:hypothetical protein